MLLCILLGFVLYSAEAQNPLPKLSILISEDGKTTQFTFDSCKVDFKVEGNKYTVQPAADGCRGKLSLATLMNHFFPENKVAEKTKNFLLPDKFDVDKLVVNKGEGTVDFAATAHEQFDIIPGRFALDGTQLGLVINYNTGEVSWPKLKMNIKGKLKLGTKEVEVVVKKRVDRTDAMFSFTMDKISVTDFTKLFTDAEPDDESTESASLRDEMRRYSIKSISSFIKASYQDEDKNEKSWADKAAKKSSRGRKPVDVPAEIVGVELQNPTVWGKFDPAGTYEFVLSGKPAASFFQGLLYGIVKKPQDKPVSVGLLVVLDDFSPLKLIETITRQRDLDIPILKDLTLKFVLNIANNKITQIDNKELRATLKDYDNAMPEGVILQVSLPLKKVVSRISPSAKTDQLAEEIYVMVKVLNHKVTCTFPDNWSSDLLKALSVLAPNAQEIIPSWFSSKEPGTNAVSEDDNKRSVVLKAASSGLSNLDVKIKTLSFKYNSKELKLHMTADGPISFRNFFSIENIEFKLSRKGANAPWNFEFKSSQTIMDKFSFHTFLKKNNDNYDFEGKVDLLTTGDLVQWLGSKFTDEETMKKFDFLNFGVENFKIKVEHNPTKTFVRLTGKAILFDWDGAYLEGIIFREAQQTHLVLGLRLQNVRLDVIVSKLFNKNLAGITWLTNLNVGMMISNTNSKTLKFLSDEFKNMPIHKGFRFRAVVVPPEDCREDPICEQAKEIMAKQEKKREFVLSGVFDSEGAELKASYEGHWGIGRNFVIPSTSLVLKIGKETSIGFEIELHVVNPKLEFKGKIALSTTLSLSLEVSMNSVWQKPFNLQYIEVANLHVKVDYQPGAPWPGAQFGGSAKFGIIGNENAISITIHCGIDPINPMKNFFYGQIGRLTVESVMLAFGYSPSIPQVLRETGFPTGATISFSPSPTGIKLPSMEIQGGLIVKGKINVLGVEAECNIQVSFPDKITFMARLTPLSFATGALQLQKSKEAPSEGPMFQATLGKEATTVKIEAYARVLGIESETNIAIDDKGYQFYVYGSLFHVLTANLSVSAQYATKDRASFQVSSCLTASIPDVQKEVESTIEETTKEAKEEVKKAEEAAEEADQVNREAGVAQDGLEDSVRKHNQKLREKIAHYRAVKNDLKVKCLQQSQTAHIGGTDWDPKCIELDGGKFLGCPKWNDQKYRILDEEAYAECKGHNWLKMWWARRKQQGIEAKFAALRILKKAFRICKRIFEATKNLVSKVKEMVTKVYEIFKPVLDFMKKAAAFVLKEIVTIKKLCFSASLEAAKKDACLNFDVSLILFKTQNVELETKGCMNTDFMQQIVKAILEKLSSGVNWIKSSVSNLRSLFTSVKAETKKAKEEVNKIRIEERADEEEDDDEDDDNIQLEQRRNKVEAEPWTAEDEYFAKYAYEILPTLTRYETRYFELRRTKSPSALAASDDVMAKAAIPLDSGDLEHKVKKNAESEDSCGKLKESSSSLKGIVEKMNKLVASFQIEKKMFEKVKAKRLMKLRKLENNFMSQCLYLACTKKQRELVMGYVKNARDEHNKWSEIVKNQLQRQDEETVEYWRKGFRDSIKRLYGAETGQYLSQLANNVNEVARKMKIAVRSDKGSNRNVDNVAKTLQEILEGPGKVSISDVKNRLSSINHLLENLVPIPAECHKKITL